MWPHQIASIRKTYYPADTVERPRCWGHKHSQEPNLSSVLKQFVLVCRGSLLPHLVTPTSLLYAGGLHSDCLLRLKCIFTILPACSSEPRCTRGELHSVFSPSNEAWNISKEEDGRRWKWEGFNSLLFVLMLLPFRCKNSDNSALFHCGPKCIFWDSWIVVELKRETHNEGPFVFFV